MMKKTNNEFLPWLYSILFHSILFLLLAICGFFTVIIVPPPKIIEIAVYDADSPPESPLNEKEYPQSASTMYASQPSKHNPAAQQSVFQSFDNKEPKNTVQPSNNTLSENTNPNKPALTNLSDTNNVMLHKNTDAVSETASAPDTMSKKLCGSAKYGTGNANHILSETNGNGQNCDNAAPAEQPILVSGAPPTYPNSLYKQRAHGIVTLKILVNNSGGVEDITVTESSGYGIFDSTAIRFIRQWQFIPAKDTRRHPVPCYVTQTIEFSPP